MTVIRSGAWGLGEDEDIWEVELPNTATVADMKAQIEELYQVSCQAQKLSRAREPVQPGLDDNVRVDTLSPQRVYLHPTEDMTASMEEGVGVDDMLETIAGAVQENMEMTQAVEESLRGIHYKVQFERPVEAGGRAAGRRVSLVLDAMARAGDVQELAEAELFGSAGSEPAFLVFEGRLLPPHVPIHFAGIENGKTVVVAREPPPATEEDLALAAFMQGMQPIGDGGDDDDVPIQMLTPQGGSAR